MPDCTLPPPWSSEAHPSYFVVRDHNGQAIAYVYFENASRRRAARLISKDDARRAAANIAKLPVDAMVVVEIALNHSTG